MDKCSKAPRCCPIQLELVKSELLESTEHSSESEQPPQLTAEIPPSTSSQNLQQLRLGTHTLSTFQEMFLENHDGRVKEEMVEHVSKISGMGNIKDSRHFITGTEAEPCSSHHSLHNDALEAGIEKRLPLCTTPEVAIEYVIDTENFDLSREEHKFDDEEVGMEYEEDFEEEQRLPSYENPHKYFPESEGFSIVSVKRFKQVEHAFENDTSVANGGSESPFFDNNFVKAELLVPVEERCSFFEISQPRISMSSNLTRKRKQKTKTGPRRNARKSSPPFRPPRKRKQPNEDYTASININELPQRTSNRLRRKQTEQNIDYSHLPPKFTGPMIPSISFCHYVLERLMSDKYQPTNWLLDFATVKKKLDYRQYEDADEFAADIRSICMNPLDESLAEDSLAILHAFEELWVYMPLDPELPLVPANPEDFDEKEKKIYAMLAAVTNHMKKCRFYGNQLSLCIRRVNEIKQAQRLAAREGKTSPDLPQILKDDMDAIAAKLRPYTTIATDLLAKSREEVGKNDWIMALAPVAPELMKVLGITEEQIASATSANVQQYDSDDGILLSVEEQEKLAKDIDKLSDDDKVAVLDIIATDENVEWSAAGEDVQIELTNAKPSTFRKVVDCVAKLLERQLSVQSCEDTQATTAKFTESTKSSVDAANKRRSADSKSTAKRRQTQPHRRGAVDIEARKRELVEGIKKLGGTGTTRPIRKKVPCITPSYGVRTSYLRSSSSSSSETSSTESWSSDSSSGISPE